MPKPSETATHSIPPRRTEVNETGTGLTWPEEHTNTVGSCGDAGTGTCANLSSKIFSCFNGGNGSAAGQGSSPGQTELAASPWREDANVADSHAPHARTSAVKHQGSLAPSRSYLPPSQRRLLEQNGGRPPPSSSDQTRSPEHSSGPVTNSRGDQEFAHSHLSHAGDPGTSRLSKVHGRFQGSSRVSAPSAPTLPIGSQDPDSPVELDDLPTR